MSNLIYDLTIKGFLQAGELDGKPIYHLTTPCRFHIKQRVIKSLKESYLSDEEIGGIFWTKPTIVGDEKIYIIEQVSFVRNAIEDTVCKGKDGRVRTKKDAYLPDRKAQSEELNKIFTSNHLPVKFHSHPTKGRHIIEQITIQQQQADTSEQDRIESTNTHKLDNDNILMPRALIVGNGDSSNNIFIGLYNGFIAPVEFEESKKKIQQENIQRIGYAISSANYTDTQKILLGIGVVLLLVVLIKYPKQFMPLIFALAAAASAFLFDTTITKEPSYYNKLSHGDANIYIP